jgi:RHH-type rel operon transcriptional repressor/antitoxin RelB
MTETLSVRIDSEIRKRLELLAKQSKRSKSFLAAEAIAAYLESESWQLGEIEAAMKEADAGMGIPHEQVSEWLNSWGRKNELKAPE